MARWARSRMRENVRRGGGGDAQAGFRSPRPPSLSRPITYESSELSSELLATGAGLAAGLAEDLAAATGLAAGAGDALGLEAISCCLAATSALSLESESDNDESELLDGGAGFFSFLSCARGSELGAMATRRANELCCATRRLRMQARRSERKRRLSQKNSTNATKGAAV